MNEENEHSGTSEEPERRRSRPRRKMPLVALSQNAVEQFASVTGQRVESVSAVNAHGDGWLLQVEVLELARIPDTTSVLAGYEVELDGNGDIVGYRRVRRYSRSRLDG